MKKADFFYRRLSVSRLDRTPLRVVLLAVFLYGGDGIAGECRNTEDWQNAEGGLTALHLAARESKLAEVQRLLANGSPVDVRSAGGVTPLHLAVGTGAIEVVSALVEAGADLEATTPLQETPLLTAIKQGCSRIAVHLIDSGADTGVKDRNGRTALELAERNRLHDVIVRLQVPPVLLTGNGGTPEQYEEWLRAAIEADLPSLAHRLMSNGAWIQPYSVTKKSYWYTLEHAVENDAVRVVTMLLERGYIKEEDLRTGILETAAIHESERVARLLIEHGADINARDSADWTPLHFALIAHYPSRRAMNVAKLLIESSADVNVATAGFGWTPLHLAVELNEPAVVEMLLAAGAEVNARTHFGGWTPLHIAERDDYGDSTLRHLEKRRKQIVAMLHEAGAQTTAYEKGPDDKYAPYLGAAVPGGYSVAGSFTTPGAEERLVIETISTEREFVRLIDQPGTTRATMFFGVLLRYFEQICLDPHSGTHSLVFNRSHGGRIHPEVEAVFMHYDNTAGELREVYADHYKRGLKLIDKSGACHWREKSEARALFKETVAALSVGGEAVFWYLDDDGIDDDVFVPLPNRVIPDDTVAAALETIENLPDDEGRVKTRDYGEAGRWRIVDVRGNYYYSGYAVKLLWDNTREEWRSIFDNYNASTIGVDKDTLFVEEGYRTNFKFYEVDLATYKIRRIPYYDSRLDRFRNR